jgi:hypothetical protein
MPPLRQEPRLTGGSPQRRESLSAVSRERGSRSRGWVTLVIVAVVLVGVAAGYPMLNENASGVCSALERRMLTLAMLASGKGTGTGLIGIGLLGAFSNGDLAQIAAKRDYPSMPPIAGCSLIYWQTMFDPHSFQQMMKSKLDE